MSNTYSQIYLQFVFAVQGRLSLIQQQWRDELYKYISGIIERKEYEVFAINGVADHIHILVSMKPTESPSLLVQEIKRCSSKWINDKKLVVGHFNWQEGFGVFSYSQSQVDQVVKYIANQEEHHKRKTFIEEYTKMLSCFNIDYDERFIFHKIE